MRRPTPLRPSEGSPRLYEERSPERVRWWTEAAGALPPVYGERWIEREGRRFRSLDPARSKLAAAIDRGWTADLPVPGERWLYLGAASGTTASHVADLVGAAGALFAIERSLRPFGRLLSWAERWPNLSPILADARRPAEYGPLVPMVDGIYVDIAQPDQVEIALANARRFLRGTGKLLIALKTASMGRDARAPVHLERTEERLRPFWELERSLNLSPWHRSHYLVGGRPRRALFQEEGTARPPPESPGRSPPSRRPRP